MPFPGWIAVMLLEVDHVTKTFQSRGGQVRAVSDVSLTIAAGECFGIIGESGSGKSTLAGMVAGFTRPDSGSITLAGKRLDMRSRASRRQHQSQLQLIFQEPRSSFNPRMSIGDCLREPLTYKLRRDRAGQQEAVEQALETVGLPASLSRRGPHSISGGQAQRVAIARALLAEPALIVCDEITSALDVTVQATILDLLARLRAERDLSLLFISHDIAVVAQIADRMAVMSAGRIVEQGPASRLITDPRNPYTRDLIAMA